MKQRDQQVSTPGGTIVLCVIDEVGMLMPNENANNRDIVLHYRDGGLHHISELHRDYDPLRYPLIFSQGTDGWHINHNKKTDGLGI